MTIESSGHSGPRYRQHPDDPRRVQVQHKPRQRWQDATYGGKVLEFADAKGARMWVWQMEQRNGKGITE